MLNALIALYLASVFSASAFLSDRAGVTTQRVSCTFTAGAATNISGHTTFCWREGQHLIVDGIVKFNGAGGAGSRFKVVLPAGYTIDTSLLSNGTDNTNAASPLGPCGIWSDHGVAYKTICPMFDSTTQIWFTNNTGDLLMSDLAADDEVRYNLKLPIVGW